MEEGRSPAVVSSDRDAGMVKAADRAYERIRRRIISGEYAAGSHLKEEQLAEETGVSRTPVREALRRLSAEQLVKFVANRGAYVATWTAEDVDDIFQLRAMLEGYAAARAASRITRAAIAELERHASEIERLTLDRSATSHCRMMELNHALHTIVIEAACSERLSVMLSWLVEIPIILKTIETYDAHDLERSNNHHRELIAALKANDAIWAQKVMEAHLYAAHQIYISRGEACAVEPAPRTTQRPARQASALSPRK